jgi:SAM-dependent methyltransferase
VLDVACGVGLPALMEAELVGSRGSVLAVDVAHDMLAGAARIARAKGIANIEFRSMDAQALELPDASFDAATFSFGLMFCADRPRAVAELRRVLAPGAGFAIAVWDTPEKNPFFTTLFGPVSSLLPPAPAPSGPGMFDLADDAALAEVLRAGGQNDFSVERVPMLMEFESLDHHFALFADMAPPLKLALASLPPAEVAELRLAITASLAPYMAGERVRLPAAALVASGRR